MKKVFLSKNAEQILDDYFYHYQYLGYKTDMPIRAFNYSKIITYLSHIDDYWEYIYFQNNKNFIDVEDFCTVEFSKNENTVLVKDIYFKDI